MTGTKSKILQTGCYLGASVLYAICHFYFATKHQAVKLIVPRQLQNYRYRQVSRKLSYICIRLECSLASCSIVPQMIYISTTETFFAPPPSAKRSRRRRYNDLKFAKLSWGSFWYPIRQKNFHGLLYADPGSFEIQSDLFATALSEYRFQKTSVSRWYFSVCHSSDISRFCQVLIVPSGQWKRCTVLPGIMVLYSNIVKIIKTSEKRYIRYISMKLGSLNNQRSYYFIRQTLLILSNHWGKLGLL